MRRSLLLAISLVTSTACGPTIVDAGAASADPASGVVDDGVVDDGIAAEPDASEVPDEETDATDTDGVDPVEPEPAAPTATEPAPTEPTEPAPTEPEPAPEASPSPSSTTGGTTTEPITRTVRTLQWNIAGGKENNCQTADITRAVRRFVVDKNIDVVSLNEVCPAQFGSIERALRSAWGLPAGRRFAAYAGDGTNRVVGNGLYSRFGLEQVSRQTVGADQYGSRFLVCGRVPSMKHLRLCSTHLTPGDGAARVQLNRVMRTVEGFWNDHRDTVILAGDINLLANDVGLDDVYSAAVNTPNNRGNTGRYREVDDDDSEHCRGYGERSTPGLTGGPCREGGKIDFIFVRENRLVDGDHGGDTLASPTDCSGVCSDHRPVVGRVRVRIRRD